MTSAHRAVRIVGTAAVTMATVGTFVLFPGARGHAGARSPDRAADRAVQPADCAGAPWMDPSRAPQRRASALLDEMTLDEKVQMTHAISDDEHSREIPPITRLCVPALLLNNGPAGVSSGGPVQFPATALPAPISLAATFDPAAAQRYGTVGGSETRAQGRNLLEGPNVNIARTPLNGRTFEAYGEDPYLAGQIAVGDIRGVQRQGVIANVKHYDANNQETDRDSINDLIDERTLHEIYLPAFEAAVKSGRVGSVMCAKNLVNGTHSCENGELLNDILKHDWGFPGFVVSDFTSCHSTVGCATGGMDLELPEAKYYGDALKAAVQAGTVSMAQLDDHVRRVLVSMFRFGLFDRPATTSPIPARQHGAVARHLAELGTVLLKNRHHLLPLKARQLDSIALIGAGANTAGTGGGGSSDVGELYRVSPARGIAQRVRPGTKVDVVDAPPVDLGPPGIPTFTLTPPDAPPGEHGLRAEYFANPDWQGDPVRTRVEPYVDADYSGTAPVPQVPANGYSIRWTGTFTAPVSGAYTLATMSHGHSTLYLDGQQIVDNGGGFPGKTTSVSRTLVGGQPHTIRVDFSKADGMGRVELSWQPPRAAVTPLIRQAVAAARRSDVAVVFAGDKETEAIDRTSLQLPGYQDRLVRAVAAANPRTVVVLKTGGPVLMPWLRRVPAVTEAWYPGEEDGHALAAVLFGDVNPSGKLPITFPRSDDQTPIRSAAQYPGVDGTAQYSEGLQVGYRWYDAAHLRPLFPFGHGLSYTSFRFARLKATARALSVDVTNTGNRAGAEVVQVYVTHPAGSGEPPDQLEAFRRVVLRPHQTARVHLRLTRRAFASWDADTGRWTVPAGRYRVRVGDSSRQLPLSAPVRIG